MVGLVKSNRGSECSSRGVRLLLHFNGSLVEGDSVGLLRLGAR